MNIIILGILALATFALIYYCKKKSILPSFSGEIHQQFVEKKSIPVVGGIFILISYLILFYELDIYFSLSLTAFFLLGIFSDLKVLKSPTKRFLLQFLILSLLIIITELTISVTRVNILDELLTYREFNYFFVLFCLLIVINGTNFIDGLNGLALGYYISILLTLILFNLIELKSINYIYWLLFLTFIFILNISNKTYIGESGSYVLGLIFSFKLILINTNNIVSPFFIVLLLWYPCFEILFSILRKFKIKKSPILPDAKHLHQLLFYFVKIKSNLSDLQINNFTSLLINFYNLIIFIIAANNCTDTQLQLILILFNIFIYTFLYLKLFKFRYIGKGV